MTLINSFKKADRVHSCFDDVTVENRPTENEIKFIHTPVENESLYA